MKRCFVLLLLASSVNCFAESEYTLDLTIDLIIGSASLGPTVSSFFVSRSADNSSKDNFPLTKGSVNSFDRGLAYKYNKPLDITGDVVLYGLIAMPVASLAGNFYDGNAWATYGVMYAESALLVFGTCEILKDTIQRYRPYCYFGDVPSGKGADYYKSFPSRHTAFAFMSAGFLTSTFFTEYPDSPWKIPLSAASYSLAAGVGVSRIFSGSHFISDILAGAALGSVYGYLIPLLHLRKNRATSAGVGQPRGMSQGTVNLIPLLNGFVLACKF